MINEKDGNKQSKPEDTFQCDKRKQGWKLRRDVGKVTLLPIIGLELVSFYLPREKMVTGFELMERAQKMGANLGQLQAEYVLINQIFIPENWRSFVLLFPGTVWITNSKIHYNAIPLLEWNKEKDYWLLGFTELYPSDIVLDSSHVFVMARLTPGP